MNRNIRNKSLRPVHPDAALEEKFRRDLCVLSAKMHNEFVDKLHKAIKSSGIDDLAYDGPIDIIRRAMAKMVKIWQKNFDEAAPKLAEYFSTEVKDRSDARLKKILRDGGFSVKFDMTPAMKLALSANISDQVNLIKSIPQEYFLGVQGAVMRGAAAGRDMGEILDEIGGKIDLSRIRMGRRPRESDKSYAARLERRAIFIARDQTNKATATMQQARQLSLGVEKGIWVHSHGGKNPRKMHVAAHGKEFDLAKGMLIDGIYVIPGYEPNCRCTWKPVIPKRTKGALF